MLYIINLDAVVVDCRHKITRCPNGIDKQFFVYDYYFGLKIPQPQRHLDRAAVDTTPCLNCCDKKS